MAKVKPTLTNVGKCIPKMAGSSGPGLKELEKILESELSGKRRAYVVLRIAMRVNKLREQAFMDEVIRRLTNG